MQNLRFFLEFQQIEALIRQVHHYKLDTGHAEGLSHAVAFAARHDLHWLNACLNVIAYRSTRCDVTDV